jgi:CheY-like chemotaxis protein
MDKTVLIIEDEAEQAEGLRKSLSTALPDVIFESYSGKNEILYAIEHRFYSLAIVDIRMDKYDIDGLALIKNIISINPFAKIIVVSAYTEEYFQKLSEILLSGRVVGILHKVKFAEFSAQLARTIAEYFSQLEQDPSEVNNALLQYYAEAKNELDAFKKGLRFERFISLLFGSFGYKEINKRVKDQSLNEVDLIVRNETDDTFLTKFGKYILIECKNYPDRKVNKNDFILFNNKVKNTNGLAELGVFATSGHITWNTYVEAIRESNEAPKIIFMSNPEIEAIIRASDKREAFKRLIDAQVKDN